MELTLALRIVTCHVDACAIVLCQVGGHHIGKGRATPQHSAQSSQPYSSGSLV
jgi:hypothetical protein